MIETIMIFALGFLAGAFIALLIIPAINARAERLARKRIEAQFPLSISELTAEKDHLRAEFAVLQRRIERKAEEARAVKHQSMEELGRRAVRIEALESLLAERDQSISDLDTDLSDTRSRLAATAEDLAQAQTSLNSIRETLTALENAHRATLDELSSNLSDLDQAKTVLAGLRSELALTQDKLAAQESAYADLDRRHTAALSELDAKRITISDLETRLMTQTARGDDFERALGERRGELSDERQRLADLAKDLAAEQERGLLLDQRMRDIMAERDEKAAEASALAAKLEELADKRSSWQASLDERHAAMEAKLAAAGEERAQLEKELHRLRADGTESDSIQAENAELRQRIIEVADLVMQDAKATPEGPRRRRSAAK